MSAALPGRIDGARVLPVLVAALARPEAHGIAATLVSPRNERGVGRGPTTINAPLLRLGIGRPFPVGH